jgi:hypothetical protein
MKRILYRLLFTTETTRALEMTLQPWTRLSKPQKQFSMKKLFESRPILTTTGIVLSYIALVASLLLVIYKLKG